MERELAWGFPGSRARDARDSGSRGLVGSLTEMTFGPGREAAGGGRLRATRSPVRPAPPPDMQGDGCEPRPATPKPASARTMLGSTPTLALGFDRARFDGERWLPGGRGPRDAGAYPTLADSVGGWLGPVPGLALPAEPSRRWKRHRKGSARPRNPPGRCIAGKWRTPHGHSSTSYLILAIQWRIRVRRAFGIPRGSADHKTLPVAPEDEAHFIAEEPNRSHPRRQDRTRSSRSVRSMAAGRAGLFSPCPPRVRRTGTFPRLDPGRRISPRACDNCPRRKRALQWSRAPIAPPVPPPPPLVRGAAVASPIRSSDRAPRVFVDHRPKKNQPAGAARHRRRGAAGARPGHRRSRPILPRGNFHGRVHRYPVGFARASGLGWRHRAVSGTHAAGKRTSAPSRSAALKGLHGRIILACDRDDVLHRDVRPPRGS